MWACSGLKRTHRAAAQVASAVREVSVAEAGSWNVLIVYASLLWLTELWCREALNQAAERAPASGIFDDIGDFASDAAEWLGNNLDDIRASSPPSSVRWHSPLY